VISSVVLSSKLLSSISTFPSPPRFSDVNSNAVLSPLSTIYTSYSWLLTVGCTIMLDGTLRITSYVNRSTFTIVSVLYVNHDPYLTLRHPLQRTGVLRLQQRHWYHQYHGQLQKFMFSPQFRHISLRMRPVSFRNAIPLLESINRYA
jgi:hypothetical protein